MKLLRILFAITFISSALTASPVSSQTAPDPAPLVARVYFQSLTQLTQLASSLDVWEVHHDAGYVLAMLLPDQAASLLQAGYRVEQDAEHTALVQNPSNQPVPGQAGGIPGYPCYRTVEESYAAEDALVTKFPGLVRKVKIGESWDKLTPGGPAGYDLYSLVLTNQSAAGLKPRFFLMAETHAREYTTAETALRFAEYLLQNYGTDPDITWLLDYTEIHIVPVANPDGRKFAEQGEYWRKNTNSTNGCTYYPEYGVDLNRNAPFHWGGAGASGNPCDETYRGSTAQSEPETQAIVNYAAGLFPDQRGPADTDPAPADATGLFISLHSYGQDILWPYGYTYSQAPNHTGLATLGRKMAYFNDSTPEQAVDLYPTSGTADDSVYGQLGVAAYTFEMGYQFFESCSMFESSLYQANRAALLNAARHSRRPYQTPSGPDVLVQGAASRVVEAGTALTVTFQVDDTRYNNSNGAEPVQPIAAAVYHVDGSPWADPSGAALLNPLDGSFDSPVETVSAQIETAGWTPGRHTLFAWGKDLSGQWGAPLAVFLNVLEPGLPTRLEGFIHSALDNTPLAADVTAGAFSTTSNSQTGYYSLPVLPGEFIVNATASGYANGSRSGVWVSRAQSAEQDFSLAPTCMPFGCSTPGVPQAAFQPPASLAARSLGRFIDQSTGQMPLSYHWDFGDGSESTTASPLHAFPAAGQYTVTLAVTNTLGLQQNQQVVMVGPPSCQPVTDVSVGLKHGFFPSAHSRTDLISYIAPVSATLPITYTTQFGDGTASTGFSNGPQIELSHTFGASGTYTVTLSVQNCGMASPIATTTNVIVSSEIWKVWIPAMWKRPF